MTGMSSRTLQRSLAEEKTCYFEVVDQWHFRTTVRLLAYTDIKINDISKRLRCADVPSFDFGVLCLDTAEPAVYVQCIEVQDQPADGKEREKECP